MLITVQDVFDSDLSAHEKLVYLYLANCANEKRQACPSMNKIAKKCSVSRSTVKKVIATLIEKGWISKENRHFEDGNYNSNLYTLCKETRPIIATYVPF